ncbi:MAG: CDP-2,3-bis-(O-geranylgeranyl)-sn-glycerol synthase [ANME-2 cluster archaeon]|jgi:CDP-2,3-bis-(O-geranylgeranyl)-sn-glycerol synthase|nr:CDP-2,3-bis-(O-geranylgeranyl)-sn-glycerol synthase [ANME-2 cluster archaeon]
MTLIDILAASIWLMLPAYIANPMAAVFGGGTPIDLGKYFPDGRRILGNGKTIRGLVAGTACGIVIGLIQIGLAPRLMASGVLDNWPMFYAALGAYSLCTLSIVFLMAFGSLLGDSGESFIKRRLDLERGAMFPVADQLDFVLGAWVLTYIFAAHWFNTYFSFWIIVTVLVATPLLHLAANILGYLIKVKKEPW